MSWWLVPLAAFAGCWASIASAAPPVLQWPVDCQLGEDCWIVHHVDTDPGPAAQDFRCGALTYNGHKGTDIAIRDRAAMFRPVPVLAAAPGVVMGLRDSAPDHQGDAPSIKAAMDKGEECGNGVLLAHGDGWTTQYCHLKSGSVRVGKGQRVAAGALLGHVGQSGAAEFPHLHLALKQGEAVVDPFTGQGGQTSQNGQTGRKGCGMGTAAALWDGAVPATLPTVDAPMLLGAGFRAAAPRFDALLQDMRSPGELPLSAEALVLWSVVYGLRAGDTLEFKITAPDGTIFLERRFEQEKTQIRRMRFVGRSNKNRILQHGRYTGLVRVLRPGKEGLPAVWQRRTLIDLKG